MEALVGKLLFMAGGAVGVITLGQEALRADWLPALKALEAVLVPHLVLVLHTLGSCTTHKCAKNKLATIYTHAHKKRTGKIRPNRVCSCVCECIWLCVCMWPCDELSRVSTCLRPMTGGIGSSRPP